MHTRIYVLPPETIALLTGIMNVKDFIINLYDFKAYWRKLEGWKLNAKVMGTDISYIQQLPGHSGIKSTMIYTHVSNKAITRIQSPPDRMFAPGIKTDNKIKPDMIFSIKIIIVAASILLAGCSDTYQSRENIERKQLFNFNWKFKLSDVQEASSESFNDKDWRTLDLPHDWSIEGNFDTLNPAGNDGAYLPTGIGWYRKTFKVPATWEDKKISVYFEGVYQNSEVFINGISLGVRPYGYSSFAYDLTPHLKMDQENIIAVRVDNANQKNCRWYSGSGIYRNVWLLVTEKVHIKHWGVGITTPQVSSEEAIVEIKTVIKNDTDIPKKLTLTTKIKGNNGEDKTQIDIEPESEKLIVQQISVKEPLLWSPDSPGLYQAELEVKEENQVLDKITQSFGIRTIEFNSTHGFTLNGKSVILNGGCVHHDNGSLGAAAYDRAEERKVQLLKTAGFNAVRTAHNPPSEAFLEACDKLGLLVVDEAFDGWKAQKNPHDYSKHFDKWAKKDVQDLVLRDRNHPSIIMWSIGNEVIERTEPEAVEIAKMLASSVKEIDTTRPVTSAMTTWGQGWEVFDSLMAVHDICGYNYQLWRAPADHERVPSRVIVNTESYPRNAFKIWELVTSNNYIIGDFVWTAMDYLGESGIGGYYYPDENFGEHWESKRYPWHGAYCGDIDLLGWRKPISHYRSMLYNDNEKIYMAVKEPNPENGEIRITGWAVWPTWESWTWPGYEGQDIEVEVYSKYPNVRLYLNDELFGEKEVGKKEEFKATFILPYAPGVIKAVGVEDGEEKETKILQTAGKASKIMLSADRKEILADGQDLSYITINIMDNNGILEPNASTKLEFELDGPGVIVAVDNANLKDTTSYVSNTKTTWKGKALVIIKSTKESGTISLKVKSPDLNDSGINIQTFKN